MGTKDARVTLVTDDALEAAIQQQADKLGISRSSYCEMVLRDHTNSIEGIQDLPETALTYSLHQYMKKAASDGIISPVECDNITEYITQILLKTRQRRTAPGKMKVAIPRRRPVLAHA